MTLNLIVLDFLTPWLLSWTFSILNCTIWSLMFSWFRKYVATEDFSTSDFLITSLLVRKKNSFNSSLSLDPPKNIWLFGTFFTFGLQNTHCCHYLIFKWTMTKNQKKQNNVSAHFDSGLSKISEKSQNWFYKYNTNTIEIAKYKVNYFVNVK